MNVPYKGKFKVSQIYKGSTHKGIDLVGLSDKNIHSVCNGVVEVVRHDTHPTGGFGLYIRVKENETGRYFYYAHLSKALVKAKDEVAVGTWIGIEGSTGHSTGSHLHFEIREKLDNRTFIDPTQILGLPNVLGNYESDSYQAMYERELYKNQLLQEKLDEIRKIVER